MDLKDNCYRSALYQGLEVDIVLKKDQKTMTLTRGHIQDFLTNKNYHPRGIKVRLKEKGANGEELIGRVVHTYHEDYFSKK